MKKITILAIALFGLVYLVDAKPNNILVKETKECLLASVSSQTIRGVTAYKKSGNATVKNSNFTLKNEGGSWKLVSSGGSSYAVYPLRQYVTINKNVVCTHSAGSWYLCLDDYVR